MKKILTIIDNECASLSFISEYNNEIIVYPDSLRNVPLELVHFLKSSLIFTEEKQELKLTEYCSSGYISLLTKNNELFVNKTKVQDQLIDIAEKIVKDIEGDVENCLDYNFEANHLPFKDLSLREHWLSIYRNDLLTELKCLKTVINLIKQDKKFEYNKTIHGRITNDTKDNRRIDLLTKHIWSLNFNMSIPVNIEYTNRISEIIVTQTEKYYKIIVRNDTNLEDIDESLIKSGYIPFA